MPKQKPAEAILNVLRTLSKDHPEQSLGSHIALATEEATLEVLSDKTLLEYLLSYESTLNTMEMAIGDEYFQDGNELDDEEDPYYAE